MDKTVFRKWPSGAIVALFVEIPSDPDGLFCLSYMSIGQHSGADYHGCVRQTQPARPEEYSDLADELTRIGYAVRPVRRASSVSHQKRRNLAMEWRALGTSTVHR